MESSLWRMETLILTVGEDARMQKNAAPRAGTGGQKPKWFRRAASEVGRGSQFADSAAGKSSGCAVVASPPCAHAVPEPGRRQPHGVPVRTAPKPHGPA